MKKNLKSTVSAFFYNKKGTSAVIFSLFVPLLITVVGASIDYTRYLDARQSALKALDSAGLGVATAIANNKINENDEAAVEAAAREIFDLNMEIADSNLNNFSAKLNKASATVNLNVDLSVPTTLTGIFGVDSFSTKVASSSSFTGAIDGTDRVEFSFVLDLTGSMRGSRLASLQEALRSSMNVLLPEGLTPGSPGINHDRVRVGFVPYATSVNLGDDYYLKAVGSSSVSGRFSRNTCVTEREGDNAFRDVAPVSSNSSTLYETDGLLRNARFGGVISRFRTDPCPRLPIRPLTNDREALLEDISNFVADGATGGQMGIDWGINLLAEPWQDFWPEESRPADYDDENVRKILVIMTDGAFNTAFYNNTRNPSSQNGGNLNLPRNAGFRTAIRQFGPSQRAALNHCDFAKVEEHNIEVYTIAFQAGNSAENLLFNCATQPDEDEVFVRGQGPYFYDVNDSNALVQAFREIVARELEILLVN